MDFEQPIFFCVPSPHKLDWNGNQDVYTFKPQAIYTESHNSKRKDASFYYKFTCDNKNNNPKLELTIYPTSDVNPLVTLVAVIILFVLVVIIIKLGTGNRRW